MNCYAALPRGVNMSCQHGNWPPCEECDALDARWDDGYKSGAKHFDKLRLLLREADAVIAILDTNNAAAKTRKAIADELSDA